MPYATPAALRAALEARLATGDTTTLPGLERLRRRAVFERLLVRLEHAMPGQWVLKGGMALEVRLGDRARTTRDLDLAIRQASQDADTVRDELIEALADDPEGDGFEFRIGQAKPMDPDEAGRAGWRFTVDARLDGRTFANVRLDVVARTEEISTTDRITLRSMLAFAGFPDHEIEAVDPAQHFAEKLHALTRPHGDRANSRVKDLPDLLLLVDQGLKPTPELLATVRHVFTVRATHDLPTELPDPPPDWAARYAALADELFIEESTVDAAMTRLRTFWSATLAAPTPAEPAEPEPDLGEDAEEVEVEVESAEAVAEPAEPEAEEAEVEVEPGEAVADETEQAGPEAEPVEPEAEPVEPEVPEITVEPARPGAASAEEAEPRDPPAATEPEPAAPSPPPAPTAEEAPAG